jgi:hypothetical protein
MKKIPKKYKEIEKFFKKKGLRLDDYDEYYGDEIDGDE